MTKNNDCWERLAQVIAMSGLSTNSFAQYIGMSRSEGLYQIKSGRCSITRNIANMIVSKYPQINTAWLLTGYGSMYVDGTTSEQIPFYDCELAHIADLDGLSPSFYMHIPQARNAQFAVAYHNEDMMPQVPNGTILLLQKADPQSLVYGNEYVVVTSQWTALRRVRVAEQESELLLLANDPSNYDNMTVKRADIIAVFDVRGKLILKNN